MQHEPSPAAGIAAALGAHAEAVCRRYLPHGRKQGRYWIAGDLDGARGRSLFVRLRGPGVPGKVDRICCGVGYVAYSRLGAFPQTIDVF